MCVLTLTKDLEGSLKSFSHTIDAYATLARKLDTRYEKNQNKDCTSVTQNARQFIYRRVESANLTQG